MFGLKIVTKRGLEKIKTEEYNKVLADVIELLREADKIILEPMTISGDGAIIQNNLFLGVGLTSLDFKKEKMK